MWRDKMWRDKSGEMKCGEIKCGEIKCIISEDFPATIYIISHYFENFSSNPTTNNVDHSTVRILHLDCSTPCTGPKLQQMEDRNVQICSFLQRLPVDIRLMVYRNLLSTQYAKRHCVVFQVSQTAWNASYRSILPFFGRVQRLLIPSANLVANGSEALARLCL